MEFEQIFLDYYIFYLYNLETSCWNRRYNGYYLHSSYHNTNPP